MTVPDKQHCFRLMRSLGMPEHIVVHSLQVRSAALFLADHLESTHLSFDRRLLQAAALLHDITKNRSFTTSENHAQSGAQFLVEQGFTDVADVVRQHVRLDSYSQSAPIGAAAIVNYADKRVLHDAIVSLDERMQYIYDRYGESDLHRRRIRKLWQMTADLETRIFARLDIGPADLTARLSIDGFDNDLAAFRRAAADQT